MAISVEDTYPGRSAPASAAYPEGAIQNETIPNSSDDGTPLDELWGNDIEALKQAVMLEAGIVPTIPGNIPDTALSSQWLTGFKNILGQVFKSKSLAAAGLTNLTAADAGRKVFLTSNDGGEFIVEYNATPGTYADDGGAYSGTQFIPTAGDGTIGLVRFRFNETVPEMFGGVGDGDGIGGGTDNTVALQLWASHTYQSKALYSTYFCDDILTFPQHVSIKGGGSGVSKIDFTGATGVFSGNRCIDFSQGSFSAIANLNADVAKGDTQIPFAAAHGLSKGDVFVISNPTDFSWSGHLANYKAGEMCVVTEVVSSTIVNISEPLYDDYVAASIDCYSMDYGTVDMEGVQLIGIGSDSIVTTLFASHIAHSNFEDVFVSGGGDRASDIRFSFDIKFNGTSYQYNSDVPGNAQYGLTITFCQDFLVDGDFQAERHAITTGSTSGVGAIVNRNIHISGNLKSLIRAALDFHGNIEHSSFNGGTINGAIAIGGDNNAVRNCTILGNDDIESGKLIRLREMLGCNFEFSNINGISQGDPSLDGGSGLIDAGGNNTTTLTADTTRGGTLRFTNILMDGANALSGIRLVNRGCTQDIDVVINGLSPRLSLATTAGFGYLRLENISGGDFRSLTLDGVSNPNNHPISTTFDITNPPFGAFTPTLEFGGAAVGMAGSFVGRFEVRGNVVNWWVEILLTAKGSSTGGAVVGNLPFVIDNVSALDYPAVMHSAFLTFTGVPTAVHNIGQSEALIMESRSGLNYAQLTDAGFANNTRIRISGAYQRDY